MQNRMMLLILNLMNRKVTHMASKKSILVTVFTKNGINETVYGKYNAVTRKRQGWTITSQKLYMCTMSDDTYWANSTHTEITT